MNNPKFSVFRLQAFRKQCTRKASSLDCNFPRPIVVTLTGVNSRVGRAVALLLKQSRVIDELRLFDLPKGPCGIALDLSNINTRCKVRAYEGFNMLKPAVQGAHVVAVLGGESVKAGHLQRQLFKANADYVRNIAIHTSEFNPKGILCVETPPVTAMVPLVSEEYKRAKAYNWRRIMGITATGVMRSNTIIGNFTSKEPHSIKCPVVGGMCRKTMIPVLSQADVGEKALDKTAADILHTRITDAETEVLKLRYFEDAAPCTSTIALSTARFINSVCRGQLKKFKGWECAFIRQRGDVGKFLPYMSSIITLGGDGVKFVRMPKLDKQECIHLMQAADLIRMHIEWGENFVVGSPSKKTRTVISCADAAPSCSLIQIRNVVGVGDVIFDTEDKKSAKQKSKRKSKQKRQKN